MSLRCLIDVRRLPTTLPGTLVSSEDFNPVSGANQDYWPSQWQSLIYNGSSTIVNYKGRMTSAAGYKALRQGLTAINLKNVEVYAEFTPLALTEAYLDISVRQDLSRKGPYPDGYFVSMDTGGTGANAVWTLGASDTNTGQFNNTDKNVGAWTVEPWAVRLRALESVITAKVWKVSAGEASATTQTLTDTNYNRSGSIAVGYNSGSSTDPGVDWDSVRVYDLGNVPTDVTTTYSFTGTNGSTVPAAWSLAKGVYGGAAYPTTPVVIQNNAMRIASGTTAAWSGGGSIFLGDPTKPEGNSSTSAPAIVSNATYKFRQKLLNLTQQYPSIILRGRGADLWSSGAGVGQPRTGYALQLGVKEGNIDVVQNYNSTTIASFPYTFTSNDIYWEIQLDRKKLNVRIWPAASAKPTSWTYSADNVLVDESDGSIGFSISNGPAAEQKYFDISEFSTTVPILSLGTNRTVPPTAPSGFTRKFEQNFDTTAAAGNASGQFMNVYANFFQPYNEGGTVGNGAMSPRTMISAHDGVMDVKMDGVYASAGSFGDPTGAYNNVGGRFSIRMKTLGGYNNGPAFMIWPSSEVWYEGELDFPESVSGRGGTQGFQDSPWIHHHKMVQGQEAQAQDVNLLVSWRDWHVYTLEWYPPGKGATPTTGNVRYLVDGVEVYNTTTDVPKTAHRFCFQIGDWGAPGNIYIDWYTIDSLN